MATQTKFTVTKDEGAKEIPLGTKRFTQFEDGAEAFLLEATNAADIMGEPIYRGVPYTINPTIQYYVRSPMATASFGIVAE